MSVGERTATAVPSRAEAAHGWVAAWLFFCAALVFAMVLLGGVTRLTESGLSIVDWKPLMGIIPPTSEAAWQELFGRYQQFPEYRTLKLLMTLEEFKTIYWFEYAHRLLGRAIGVAFFAPFLFFLFTRRLERRLAAPLAGVFLLGAAQGVLGWYMVKSGLVNDPWVSPYRLTAHLALAVVIYALILWLALDLASPRPPGPRPQGLRLFARLIWLFTFVTLLSGGFVAGNDAGLAYNTFPLMGGRLFPEDYALLEPFWRNLFESVPAVQFNHRLLAVSLVAAIAALWVYALIKGVKGPARLGLHGLLAMALVQLGLGISTLLLYVPVPLASLHQAGALVLFTLALLVNHALRGATLGRPLASA